MIYPSKSILGSIVRFIPVIVLLATALPVLTNWTQRQKITSTPRSAGAQHGNAVAMNGNTMVVGARNP